jgi:hypothetical protein
MIRFRKTGGPDNEAALVIAGHRIVRTNAEYRLGGVQDSYSCSCGWVHTDSLHTGVESALRLHHRFNVRKAKEA